MDSNFWVMIGSISTSVASLAAVGSLIFFIMQYISENTPKLEIVAELKRDDADIIKVKNSGNRNAQSVEFSNSIGLIKYGTLFKGDVLEIELYQRDNYEEIYYRRFKWSKRIYLKSYRSLEKINDSSYENYIPKVNSISGRLKLKKILKVIKKDSANETHIKIIGCDESRSLVEFEYKNEDGFTKIIQEFFESNISVVTFYLSEVLKEYDFICDNNFENKKDPISLLIVNKDKISKSLLKELNIFKIFIPTLFETKYNYIGNSIDNFKVFDSLEDLDKDGKFMIDLKSNLILKLQNKYLRNVMTSYIGKRANRYHSTFSEGYGPPAIPIKSSYITRNQNYIIISGSRIDFSSSVITDFRAMNTTIIDIKNRLIYSSHDISINNRKLSEIQFDEFMRQFDYACSKRKKFNFNKPSKIAFKYKIESKFVDRYIMK